MRSHRMRGYGSWCMGWRDAERNPGPPPSDNGGCFTVFFIGFVGLLALSFFKVVLETGNGMGLILGLAVIAGAIKGMSK